MNSMVTSLHMNCALTSRYSPVLTSLPLLPTLLPRHLNPPRIEAVNSSLNMVVPVVVDAPIFLEAEAPLNFLPTTLAPLVPSARYALRLVTLHRLVSIALIRIFKSPLTNLHKPLLLLHDLLWTRHGTQTLVQIIISLLIMAT